MSVFFFFNATATTEFYTLSLHDALPIWVLSGSARDQLVALLMVYGALPVLLALPFAALVPRATDRKSTRLNSSHVRISYAVFCLKKKKIKSPHTLTTEHHNSRN